MSALISNTSLSSLSSFSDLVSSISDKRGRTLNSHQEVDSRIHETSQCVLQTTSLGSFIGIKSLRKIPSGTQSPDADHSSDGEDINTDDSESTASTEPRTPLTPDVHVRYLPRSGAISNLLMYQGTSYEKIPSDSSDSEANIAECEEQSSSVEPDSFASRTKSFEESLLRSKAFTIFPTHRFHNFSKSKSSLF